MYDLLVHLTSAAMGLSAFIWRWDSKTKERQWVRWQFLVVSALVAVMNTVWVLHDVTTASR